MKFAKHFQIYLVAENRVVKITFLNIGTSEAAAEVFFSQVPGEEVEIIGLSVSMLSSSVFINVKNRGLFAYMTRGQLLWSAGPVLYRFGYRQGCRKNVTDCFFTSVPMVDQCEASVYVRVCSSLPFILLSHGAPFEAFIRLVCEFWGLPMINLEHV
jgi:hypothetical protein